MTAYVLAERPHDHDLAVEVPSLEEATIFIQRRAEFYRPFIGATSVRPVNTAPLDAKIIRA